MVASNRRRRVGLDVLGVAEHVSGLSLERLGREREAALLLVLYVCVSRYFSSGALSRAPGRGGGKVGGEGAGGKEGEGREQCTVWWR